MAMKGWVALVRLLVRCTARRQVTASSACSWCRATVRQEPGATSRSCNKSTARVGGFQLTSWGLNLWDFASTVIQDSGAIVAAAAQQPVVVDPSVEGLGL